ncbi:transcriptional regulator [Pseudomonas sp. MDT1-85]
MTTYNWDLIERLLHEVQNGAGHSFTPRPYAEQYAAAKANAGEPFENLDHLKTVAGKYEKLLLLRGYIEPRPEDQGGNGENYILTPRGSRLLSLIDSSIPGNEHPRQVLDEQEDALEELTFDEVASKAQIA